MLLRSCCLSITCLKNVKSSIVTTSVGCLMGCLIFIIKEYDLTKHVLNIEQARITHVLQSIKKSLSPHSTIKFKTGLEKG